MGERYVIATVKGMSAETGIGTGGIVSRAQAISDLRSYHERQKRVAEKVLAATDEEIETWVVEGVHAQRKIRELKQ